MAADGTKRTYDLERVEQAVKELLSAIGEDPSRDGLRDTPQRVAKMFLEMTSELFSDPGEHLDKVFDESHGEMVMVKDITFTSLCEHHLVPFFGKAHVAYIPNNTGRITGLSKLARLVEGYARRLQVQERMTTQIAQAIEARLHPIGTLVVIEAEHMCMSMRGIKKPGAITVTSAVRGVFETDISSRQEAMAFIRG
jgi:GTP cyclohydrolase I